MNNKKILLVGGCGFIGHNLAIHLKKMGADPIIVDSLAVNNILSFADNDIKNKKLYSSILNSRIELLNSNNIPIHPRVKGLYNYLQSNRRIEDLNFNPDVLGIFSREILKRIRACEVGTWEDSVPHGVAEIIKEKNLFDSSTCNL